MKSIILSHKKQILTLKNKQVERNCRVNSSFTLDNRYLVLQRIYQADIRSKFDDEYKYHQGLAEKTFKEQYGNHKISFNNENSKNSTKLSKIVWLLRENGKVPSIN